MTPSYPLQIGIAITAIIALAPTSAHAYLDPGTGSALVQGLIAAIAAIGITLKLYWHRVLVFLGIRERPKPASDDGVNSSEKSVPE